MESSSSIKIPELVLSSSGCKIPVFGMGTAAFPNVPPSPQIKAAILQSIELGYRHFDTAKLYLSEEPLGEAIAEALSRGLIKSREQLFITTKLWCRDAHPHLVLPALQTSLKALQLDYVDLYLIHWPVSSRHGIYEFPIKEKDFMPMDFKGVWAAMEKCQKLGLATFIGVSNFSCKKLSEILAFAEIPPAVNQVEINPLWQQKKLLEFCKAKGILLTAYSALGGNVLGSNRVLDTQVLKDIAFSKEKSIAQICLRWGYEQGICVLVKSFNKERMVEENIDIFNWSVSEEEHKKISEIPQSRGCPGEDYTHQVKGLSRQWRSSGMVKFDSKVQNTFSQLCLEFLASSGFQASDTYTYLGFTSGHYFSLFN